MRNCGAIIGAVLVCGGGAWGAEAGWKTYVNPRFGVAVDYPAVFRERDRPPDNGDGQTFRTPGGGAVLKVFGGYNIENESAAQLMQSRRRVGTVYAYSHAGKAWFVLSAAENGRTSYLRCNLKGDVEGCVELDYPEADASQWTSAVNRLSRSLRILPVELGK